MCPLCALYAPTMRALYFHYVPSMCLYALSMHPLCALYVPTMRPLCAHYAPTMRPLCALYAPSMHPLCALKCDLYAPTMRPLCAHYAPSMRREGKGREGKGPQRRPQKRLGRRLEGVAKAVGGGYCRLQMPLRLALAVRETAAGHRLGALEGGLPPLKCIPDPPFRAVHDDKHNVRSGSCCGC